ncbi:MAG TPA: RodZ domain-containing protein [Bryobacteraceae bacterium]|nr:RodZ domain-containing protein [Bryobacteraceae bacterium]
MTSIGEMLRGAREAQGRSVAGLAAELCITQRYLSAIEADDVEVLPGVFFFQSFARQYAAILGLDPTEVRLALAAMEPPPESAASADANASPLRAPDPIVADTNRRYLAKFPVGLSVAGLLAAVLLGSGIYAWWMRPAQSAPVTASAPKSVVREVPQPAPAVVDVSTPPDAPTAVDASLEAAAGVEAPAAVEAAASVDDTHQVTLNLSATERTWLSITSQGKVIFSGILEPSQSKTLKGAEVATMKVGNAGGVDIQWNGKSIGPIGPRGQVRTIRFTREHFHILSSSDESPGEL